MAKGFTGPILPAEQGQRRKAATKRKKWEATESGQARTHNVEKEFGMPAGQVYHAKGWGTPTPGGHAHNQDPIPGLEREDAAPKQTRWEDLHPDEQKRTHRALAQYGTSIEQMHHDFGAQVDQSFLRADRHDTHPFAQHFYTEGEPAQVIKRSAEQLGVPLGVHVAMNAFTSPQTKFKQGNRYPNDETAQSVVRQVQGGTPAKEVTTGPRMDDPTKKNQGFDTNARKAADVLEQHFHGVPVSEWKSRISSSRGGAGVVDVPENKQQSPFGPKTGPYHNAWLPGAQDFFVSDVHSGGGGMLPHLGSEKAVATHPETGEVLHDSKGMAKRTKSEREEAMLRIPNFHAAADHVARNVMRQRGLTSTRQTQAAQWGEEQLQRTEAAPRLAMATEEKEYAAPARERRSDAFKQIPGQGSLL